MSLILDALRRAETERAHAHGQVPGLHTPNLAPIVPRAVPSPAWRRTTWVAVGVLLTGTACAVMWLHSSERAPAVPQATETTQPAALPTAEAHLPPPHPVPPAPTAPLVPLTTRRPEPPSLTPPTTAMPKTAARHTMPPQLVISGSVYSEDPSSRFLIIRGEVVHEGTQVAPGCTLEQIHPHDIVLNCQGERHQQPL